MNAQEILNLYKSGIIKDVYAVQVLEKLKVCCSRLEKLVTDNRLRYDTSTASLKFVLIWNVLDDEWGTAKDRVCIEYCPFCGKQLEKEND